MSRVFEALQQLNAGGVEEISGDGPIAGSSGLLSALSGEVTQLDSAREFTLPSIPTSRIVAISEPHTLAAEKLRGLAARLRQMRSRKNGNRIVIASAVRGDGKSMISANLAVTLALQGDRTLLIDGDLHKPTLHHLLGIRDRRGLTDWTEQDVSIAEFMFREKTMPLWFLPAGNAIDQPLTHIQAPATSELVARFGTWFDWVIIDSPPLTPLADSNVWSSMCDWVLLIVREGSTPKKVLVKAVDTLDKAKLCGVILNDAVSTDSKYYRQYYQGFAEQRLAATSGK